jgi:hypothetical protein
VTSFRFGISGKSRGEPTVTLKVNGVEVQSGTLPAGKYLNIEGEEWAMLEAGATVELVIEMLDAEGKPVTHTKSYTVPAQRKLLLRYSITDEEDLLD